MTQEEANKIFQPGQSINIQLIEGAKNFVPLSPTTIIAIVSTGIFVESYAQQLFIPWSSIAVIMINKIATETT